MKDTNPTLERYLSELRRVAATAEQLTWLWRLHRRRPSPGVRAKLLQGSMHKIALIVLGEFPRVSADLALEMIQDAVAEVTGSVDRFDPEEEVPFGAFIHERVRTSARRTYRRLSTVVKFPHTHPGQVPPTCGLEAIGTDTPDETEGAEAMAIAAEAMAENKELLRRALSSMPKQQRTVFRGRVLTSPQRSIEEIATELGVSRTRVQTVWNQAHDHAMRWLG